MALLHSRVFKLVSGNGLWFYSHTQYNKPMQAMSLLPKPSFGMIPLPASGWRPNFVGLIFKICVKMLYGVGTSMCMMESSVSRV
jgi:hypothetical protein